MDEVAGSYELSDMNESRTGDLARLCRTCLRPVQRLNRATYKARTIPGAYQVVGCRSGAARTSESRPATSSMPLDGHEDSQFQR